MEESQDRRRLVEAVRVIERLSAALRDRPAYDEPIAVVGLGCRMPGGGTGPDGFWRVIRDGVDATAEFPADRADAHTVFDPDPDAPGKAYVIRGGFLDSVDQFEPAVFGISPREAIGMDPQQRLTLEVAWEALEHAGYAPDSLEGSLTGVYLGVSTTDYVRMRQQDGDPADIDAYQLIGEPSFMAGRVSYTLGLMGPSQVVDTACSSSLVALHDACRALRLGECDLALAGGVNLMLSPYGFVLMSKFRALARDGRCKTFDAEADGYARGEGAGIVVLKRLGDAQRDGDTVHAVIHGTAVNHDGRSSGMTVPNPAAQQAVVAAALRRSPVQAGDIDYVEAHGTGTSLGDPIELHSLEAAIGRHRPDGQPLLVGSVKTNIGHLESAAGVAGLLKLILALRHRQIPPHLLVTTPNPLVQWDRLHIEVPTRSRPWPVDGRPRVGAVSSFGASGTNAHAIVAEAPPPAVETRERRARNVLTLSARTDASLVELARRYATELASRPDDEVGDVCFTSHVGRARMANGVAVAGGSMADLVRGLTTFAGGERSAAVVGTTLSPHRNRKVAWLFTGQGAQYQDMGQGLRSEPAYRAAFDEVAALVDDSLEMPLGKLLELPDRPGGPLDQTGNTQPALFAVEYALAQLWLSWGVTPAAVTGHSLGEIVAACVAGVLDLPDAARLVVARGRAMQALPAGGAMATLVCDEERALAAVAGHPEVSVAAVNGPADTVIAGPADQVAEIAAGLAAVGVKHRLLRVSHAFHSPLMAPALDDLRAVVATVRHRPPRLPIISNVTGQPWGEAEQDPEYWLTHAMAPVRFQDGVRTLYDQGFRTFLEVGPQPVLLGLGSRGLDDAACAWLPSLRRGDDDQQVILSTLGALHLRGATVDWAAFHEPERPRRVPLPTYAWRGQRYWFPTDARPGAAPAVDAGEPVDGIGRRLPGPYPCYDVDLDAAPDLAAVVDLALRAAGDGLGGVWRGAGDLVPGAPWRPDPGRRVRLVLGPGEAPGTAWFACRSTTDAEEASGAPWRDHLSGVLHRRPTGETRVPEQPPGTPEEPWRHPDELLMRMVWQPAPPVDADPQTGPVLVFGTGEPADRLAAEFAGRGVPCTVAPPVTGADLTGTVARWRAEHAGPGRIVVLTALATPPPDGTDQARIEAFRDQADLFTVAVVRAVLDTAAAGGIRVFLVTRGAVDTGAGQARHDPFGATVWGIGRVLALEHPEHWGGAVDLDPDRELDAAALAAALDGSSEEDQQALRAGGRLVARVRPSHLERRLLRREVAIRSDGEYVITGAFGGIGRTLTHWLAARGAGRIVLLGRTALPDRARWDDPDLPASTRARIAQVRDAERLGAEVEVVQVDVADAGALRAALAGGRLPLRGVIHAAGVSSPQFLRDVDPQVYDDVWRPKVLGGWALHQATAGAELDFFLLFSSIAATWGSQHLTSYAAANAFLDALAAHRRSLGQRALSIAWSSWELPSGLFDDDVVTFLTSTGLRLLSAPQCVRFIGALLDSDEHHHVVCAADWTRYKAVLQLRAERPVLRDIAVDSADGPGDAPAALLDEVLAAPAADRRELLDRYVRRQLAQILRIDVADLQGEFHLLEMGLDSLMVMELISRARKDLGVQISSPEFFACDANDWADFLLRRIETRQSDAVAG